MCTVKYNHTTSIPHSNLIFFHSPLNPIAVAFVRIGVVSPMESQESYQYTSSKRMMLFPQKLPLPTQLFSRECGLEITYPIYDGILTGRTYTVHECNSPCPKDSPAKQPSSLCLIRVSPTCLQLCCFLLTPE